MADGVEYTSDVYKTFDLAMIFRAFADFLTYTIGHTFIVVLIKRVLWNHVW